MSKCQLIIGDSCTIFVHESTSKGDQQLSQFSPVSSDKVGFNYFLQKVVGDNLRMPLPFSLSSLCTSLIRPKNILLRPRLHPLPFSSIASRGSRTIPKAVTAALPSIHTQAEMMPLLPSAENKSEVWVGGEESRRRLVKVVGCYLCQLAAFKQTIQISRLRLSQFSRIVHMPCSSSSDESLSS